jgi:uncharacterized Zn-finger protein
MSIELPKVEEVTKSSNPCDGGGEHPRVWLQIPVGGKSVTCPYCDKKFELKG